MFFPLRALVLASVVIPPVVVQPGPEGTTISLDRVVHFTTAAGPAEGVGPGDVAVEYFGSSLGLNFQGRRVVVEAQWGEHPALLDSTLALAVPDEDNPDNCHVLLLMPGGTLLEIVGTYSGTRQRGILDKLKGTKVAQAAKQAGAAVKETASTVKEGVVSAGETVKEGVHSASETVQAKVQATSAAVLEALPAGPLKDLVRGMGDLGVQDLLECIATTERDGPGIAGLLDDFGADPQAFFRNLGDDVAARLDGRLVGLIRRDLEKLRKGGPPPTIEQVIDESFDTLKQVFNERPVTRCLMQALEPKLAGLKTGIASTARILVDRQQQLLEEKVLPVVFDEAAALLIDMIDEEAGLRAPVATRDAGNVQERGAVADTWDRIWGWQDRNMASGLWTESITTQFVTATEQLELALATHDADKAREALDTIEAWSEHAALKYGIDNLRYKGHKLLYKLDGRLYIVTEKAFEWMGVTIVLGDETVDAAAGLIPEIGSAIKTVCDAPLKTFWNLVGRRLVINTAKKALHAAWEGVCLAAETSLIERKDTEPGPLKAALGAFSRERVLAVADKNLPDTKANLKAYNDQLRMLVSEWEQAK